MQICPACHADSINSLEAIHLEFQHSLYAPCSESSQDDLTNLVGLSDRKYLMQCCQSCGLEFALPLKAPCSEWYEKAYSLLSLYPSSRWEFDYVIKKLKSTDTVGEIGCGAGTFIEKCQLNDIACHGIDFSSSAISHCLERGLPASLINVTAADLEIAFQGDLRSAIFSAHTLEHLDDPSQLFDLARKWSTNSAVLWISIPSNRRASRLFGEVDFLDQPPHHLTRWSPSSLEAIGHTSGWLLEEVIYEPISLRTILWSYVTRLVLYKKLYNYIGYRNIWLDRLLRYMSYPLAAVKYSTASTKITGFSMLARYSKIKSDSLC